VSVQEQNLDTVKKYFVALHAAPDSLVEFYDPDVVQEEFPMARDTRRATRREHPGRYHHAGQVLAVLRVHEREDRQSAQLRLLLPVVTPS
jgi:hypothetical protein